MWLQIAFKPYPINHKPTTKDQQPKTKTIMIYYFSGTGNSRFAANYLSKSLNESLRFIPDTDPIDEILVGESIGFVFPVYSWGVPPLVLDFVANLPEKFWNEVRTAQIPVWCVMTCGDEVALAPEMFEKVLKKKGVKAESKWSVIMPNNYVLLPGFDVDSKELEQKKLGDAPARLKEISQGIVQHRRVIDVVRGGIPGIKTKLVYPLFKKWGIFPRKWHSTSACVGCGICVGSCPLNNVVMTEGVPKWGDKCCSCLACYHSCPRHAVEYGKITGKKGQYFFK